MVVLIIRLQKSLTVRNGTVVMNLQMELTPTTQIAVKFLIKKHFKIAFAAKKSQK